MVIADTTHLLTNIDGKDMARVMLFNGLSCSKVNGDVAYLIILTGTIILL